MILVTGGAGFIGSHTCVELLQEGYELIIVDNLLNSKIEALERVQQITGKSFIFYELDLLKKEQLEQVFQNHSIEAVIHFAGLKAVGESVEKPLKYFKNNIQSTLNLCEVMQKYQVKKLVFSSSATVYGMPKQVPIKENFPLQVTNPYGRTKLMIEDILRDVYTSDREWSISLLRYFNPVGAHESGQIGEDPNGIPNNLMPFITKVAIGQLLELQVFGNDYMTKDGTGVRDYIHVVDLAQGHVRALDEVRTTKGISTYNLGTGNGYSVLEVISAFEAANNVIIPYRIVDPRPGDAAICYADSSKAEKQLHWKATKTLQEMCKDAWRWQCQNPTGYNKIPNSSSSYQNEDFFMKTKR